MPFIGPSAAAFTTFLMSSYLACRKRNFRGEKLDKLTVLISAQSVTHRLLQADRQVNHRHVGGGNTEGHAGQLAVKNKCWGKSDCGRSGLPIDISNRSMARFFFFFLTDPFSSGMTLPTALAAPVEAGMMFWLAPRPSLHSLPEGPSTVF